MKFNELSQLWIETKKETLKHKTCTHYNNVLHNHILPFWGNLELANITTNLLHKFQAHKLQSGNMLNGKPLARNSVRSMLSIIKNILNYGKELNLEISDDILPQPIKYEEKPIFVFNKQEQTRIEQAVFTSGKKNHFGIILCLYTGLRLGELLALTWEDIDFRSNLMTINKTSSVVKKNGKYKITVTSPKSNSSNRIVPISKPLIAQLKLLQKNSHSNFIISTRKGTMVSNRSYQTTYLKILKKANVPYKNFHILRHTFATRALECGIDFKTLSEIMGHSTPQITMNRYSHSLMDTKIKAMQSLGKLLAK